MVDDGTNRSDGAAPQPGWRSGRVLAVVVVVLVLGVGIGVGGVKAVHALRDAPAPASPSVAQASAGYGLDSPTAAAVSGSHVFVANQAGDSVTVIDAVTGAHVATVSGPSFGFDRPAGLAAVGPDLFVANGGDSVTEIDADSRSLVRVVSGSPYRFSDPIAITSATGGGSAAGDPPGATPPEVFVLSSDGSVTAISAVTGALVDTVPGSALGITSPGGLAVGGGRVFVTDRDRNSVTVLDEHTLAPVTVLDDPRYKFRTPTGIVVHGGTVWVANAGGDSVTEFSLATNQVVRVVVDHTNLPTPGPVTAGDGYVFTLSPPGDSPMVSQIEPSTGKVAWMMCNTNGPYLLSNPQALVAAGSDLWVVNKDGNSLTQMDSDSGALIRTIS
jgi:YVTN family beta-propeller protein